jgi:hypothetical protein
VTIDPPDRLEHTAFADLWRNTLSEIPSVFGRMVYLSSLRSSLTGRYEHHGLALVFSPEEAGRALKKSHMRAFEEWLGFNLEQQKADLDLFLSGLRDDRLVILKNWLSNQTYKTYVPSSIKGRELRLFSTDFEALLALIRTAYDGGDSPRAA